MDGDGAHQPPLVIGQDDGIDGDDDDVDDVDDYADGWCAESGIGARP